MIIFNILLLLFIYNLFIHLFVNYTNISNKIVGFQVYRSLICTFIALYSHYLVKHNWNNFIENPIYYSNDKIKFINLFLLSFFISDLCNMLVQKNSRKALWFHHLFCILVFYTHCVYLNNSSIIFTWLNIAEYMSLASGIDAVAKYYNRRKVIFWTKLYRSLVIIFIRFPIWLTVIYICNFYTIDIISKISCLLGSISMILLDIYWLRLCIRY